MSPVTFDPLASSAPLIVYIDYKSPYAYLAKDPTYAIEEGLGIEIDWRPLTLDIPSYLGSARLDEQGRLVESQRSERQWSVVKYSYRDVRRYGSRRGLLVRGTTKIWNSSLAAIGMLWAKEQGLTVLRRYSGLVYERFWRRELDIEDVAVIERVLQEAGAQTTGFRAYAVGQGRALHDEIQQSAFDAGVFGVPTYVVGGEVLFGREHLPRIRWMLSGRTGAAPDVAYEHLTAENVMTNNSVRDPLAVAIDFKSPILKPMTAARAIVVFVQITMSGKRPDTPTIAVSSFAVSIGRPIRASRASAFCGRSAGRHRSRVRTSSACSSAIGGRNSTLKTRAHLPLCSLRSMRRFQDSRLLCEEKAALSWSACNRISSKQASSKCQRIC